jgi:hypothetical protein
MLILSRWYFKVKMVAVCTSERRYPTKTLQDVITQKTSTWNITAVKASKLASRTFMGGYNPLHPEDGDSMDLWNVGILP